MASSQGDSVVEEEQLGVLAALAGGSWLLGLVGAGVISTSAGTRQNRTFVAGDNMTDRATVII